MSCDGEKKNGRGGGLKKYDYVNIAPPQLRLVPLQTAGSVEGVQLHGNLCAQRHVGGGDGTGMNEKTFT